MIDRAVLTLRKDVKSIRFPTRCDWCSDDPASEVFPICLRRTPGRRRIRHDWSRCILRTVKGGRDRRYTCSGATRKDRSGEDQQYSCCTNQETINYRFFYHVYFPSNLP